MDGPSLQDLADKVDDVARALTRQGTVLARIADTPAPTAPDLALLVDLHALRTDALTCAATARSARERAGFAALAAGLERLLTGRGGEVVAPEPGTAFRGTHMEAVEVLPTDDPAHDRTVAELREPGLQVGARSVRPARVAVFRVRS